MEADLRKVHLGVTREIELPKLDVTEHIGKRVKIESVVATIPSEHKFLDGLINLVSSDRLRNEDSASSFEGHGREGSSSTKPCFSQRSMML
jgi:hypothetical protein